MSSRVWRVLYGLPWLMALALSACAIDRHRETARDPLYDGLSAQATLAARQAVQKALETRPSNDIYKWRHENGSSGSVTPLRTFRIKTGHYCRDYAETVVIGLQPVSSMRTACRGNQGFWQVVKR